MANIANLEVQFGDLVRQGKEIVKRGRKKEEGLVLDHFDMGCLLQDIVGKTKYGDGAVERYAKEIGMKEQTLRIDYGVAKHFRFRRELIEKKVAELKEADVNITWAYFRGIVKPDSNPEVHGSPEKHKEHLLGKAEQLGEVIHEASVHYPNDEEVQGVAVASAEIIEEAEFIILGDHGKSGIKKGGAWKCPAYISFLHEQPCPITGDTKVEVHHLIYKSRGGQGSDIFGMPLSKKLHEEYHALGRAKFEEKYNIDFNPFVIHYIQKFITEILK